MSRVERLEVLPRFISRCSEQNKASEECEQLPKGKDQSAFRALVSYFEGVNAVLVCGRSRAPDRGLWLHIFARPVDGVDQTDAAKECSRNTHSAFAPVPIVLE